MSRVVFAGCSFTSGVGWGEKYKDCKDHPALWVNLCHTEIDCLKNLELVNLGHGGASNPEIFEDCVEAFSNYTDIKYMFVQWTAMPRYNFRAGFELWDTQLTLHGDEGPGLDPTINLSNGKSYSQKYLNDLLNRFLTLHHLHGEILKVVKYSKILENLARQSNTQIAFINGLCPWDDNYFTKLDDVLPEAYTPFTKKEILNIDSKTDEDIFKLYNQLHSEYTKVGSIDPQRWVNLYNSMQTTKIDTNSDNYHPGINSNTLYYNQVKDFLN